jgi:hypothetical protein
MTDIGLELDSTSPNFGDLKIVNGDLVLVTSRDEITQNIRQVLSTFYAEWFMDKTIGIDYFNQILVKAPDQGKINALLINQILGVPGVLELLSYSFETDFSQRRLTSNFKVRTTSGIIDYSGVTA